jgi:cellulose 1,4-beta-cellobiosidase
LTSRSGQCGGKGWSGATTCVTGWTCTVSNEYYSQCLPGAATTSTRPITTSSTTTRSTSSTTTRPVSTSSGTTSAPSSTTTGGTTPAPNGNPYTGRSVYVSPYYAAEVEAAAATITDASLKAKYAKIQNTPTFIWFDVAAKVPDLKTYVADAKSKNQILQIVVYDLPERDCAALSSNGELTIANGGVAKYKQYIDDIAAAIKGKQTSCKFSLPMF